jgi:hypothetical protein
MAAPIRVKFGTVEVVAAELVADSHWRNALALRDVERGRAELRRIYGGPIRICQSADGLSVEAAVPGIERPVELAVINGCGPHPATSLVPGAGLEPARRSKPPRDFKSTIL